MFELDPKPPRLHQSIGIVIPGRAPTPNARRHWRQIARDNAEWKAAALAIASNALRQWEGSHGLKWRPVFHASVVVTFSLPDRRSRDLDNLIASCKPLLDGIVQAGVITDDSVDVIDSITFGWVRDGRAATTFEIDEVDGQDEH